ncbi:hypothetical protein CA2015_1556 [Cyclobacterium amurskyense]|uniref:Uncharacterized protein n=1 Tax=Cyclobacterium amurskyense TaxID=320787 RepID=A0A0H4PDW3_9BACT|nr:hypothetical protein CA2015_1556 [Cyclobacterium amurskyense]
MVEWLILKWFQKVVARGLLVGGKFNPKYAIDILLRAKIALKYPIVAVFNFTIAVLC